MKKLTFILVTLSTMLLTSCTVPPATTVQATSPASTIPQPSSHGTPHSAAGLTIEEYAIVPAASVKPGFDLVNRVPPEAMARRQAWRNPVRRCVPGIHADCPPLVIGEHTYVVEMHDMQHYALLQDGVAIYSHTTPPRSDIPVYNLTEWEGQWVLEIHDEVIIDGDSFNEQQGYTRVFNWRVVHGQLFYFFEQDGRVRISYGGETLTQTYKEIVHNQCCEPAVCNVQTYADMVAFYALRRDAWFYVEMGVYE